MSSAASASAWTSRASASTRARRWSSGALETGWIEGDGPHYPQPKAPIRPAPERSFDGRLYAVASSDDSVEAAARLKARMTMFSDRSWKARLPSIERWRELYRELHAEEPPPPLICDFVYCSNDADAVATRGHEYMASYLSSVLEHYEIMGDHFEGLKGYDAYASAARGPPADGRDRVHEGLPRGDCLGHARADHRDLPQRWELIGPFEAAPAFRFGGIPFDEAEASVRLFAAEVLPELKSWT